MYLSELIMKRMLETLVCRYTRILEEKSTREWQPFLHFYSDSEKLSARPRRTLIVEFLIRSASNSLSKVWNLSPRFVVPRLVSKLICSDFVYSGMKLLMYKIMKLLTLVLNILPRHEASTWLWISYHGCKTYSDKFTSAIHTFSGMSRFLDATKAVTTNSLCMYVVIHVGFFHRDHGTCIHPSSAWVSESRWDHYIPRLVIF
jgi:hypothetical protein